MADPERENAHYHYGGVPLGPQARRYGYPFPVYVSNAVWRKVCLASKLPSKHGESLEKRIFALLHTCYEGMAKKLAESDDFVYYPFKMWYWDPDRPKATKQQKWKLGARLLLAADSDEPWLYIFAPNIDTIADLIPGDGPPPEEEAS